MAQQQKRSAATMHHHDGAVLDTQQEQHSTSNCRPTKRPRLDAPTSTITTSPQASISPTQSAGPGFVANQASLSNARADGVDGRGGLLPLDAIRQTYSATAPRTTSRLDDSRPDVRFQLSFSTYEAAEEWESLHPPPVSIVYRRQENHIRRRKMKEQEEQMRRRGASPEAEPPSTTASSRPRRGINPCPPDPEEDEFGVTPFAYGLGRDDGARIQEVFGDDYARRWRERRAREGQIEAEEKARDPVNARRRSCLKCRTFAGLLTRDEDIGECSCLVPSNIPRQDIRPTFADYRARRLQWRNEIQAKEPANASRRSCLKKPSFVITPYVLANGLLTVPSVFGEAEFNHADTMDIDILDRGRALERVASRRRKVSPDARSQSDEAVTDRRLRRAWVSAALHAASSSNKLAGYRGRLGSPPPPLARSSSPPPSPIFAKASYSKESIAEMCNHVFAPKKVPKKVSFDESTIYSGCRASAPSQPSSPPPPLPPSSSPPSPPLPSPPSSSTEPRQSPLSNQVSKVSSRKVSSDDVLRKMRSKKVSKARSPKKIPIKLSSKKSPQKMEVMMSMAMAMKADKMMKKMATMRAELMTMKKLALAVAEKRKKKQAVMKTTDKKIKKTTKPKMNALKATALETAVALETTALETTTLEATALGTAVALETTKPPTPTPKTSQPMALEQIPVSGDEGGKSPLHVPKKEDPDGDEVASVPQQQQRRSTRQQRSTQGLFKLDSRGRSVEAR